MKDTKRRWEAFSFYDYTNIEVHLEKMAAEGWLLEKMSAFGWVYRRIEPKKLTFTVTYYPKASVYDPEPSEEQKTLWDFCESAGWELAASAAQMQIFYNERENPVPIEADALVQAETIHKAAKTGFLPSYFSLLPIGIFQLFFFFWQIKENPVQFFSTNANLFTAVCCLFVLVTCFTEIGRYYHWYRKALAAARLDGSFVETHGSRRLTKAGILGILLVLTVVTIANLITAFLKRKKTPADTNRAISFFASLFLSLAFLTVFTASIIYSTRHGLLSDKPAETYEYDGHTWASIYHYSG